MPRGKISISSDEGKRARERGFAPAELLLLCAGAIGVYRYGGIYIDALGVAEESEQVWGAAGQTALAIYCVLVWHAYFGKRKWAAVLSLAASFFSIAGMWHLAMSDSPPGMGVASQVARLAFGGVAPGADPALLLFFTASCYAFLAGLFSFGLCLPDLPAAISIILLLFAPVRGIALDAVTVLCLSAFQVDYWTTILHATKRKRVMLRGAGGRGRRLPEGSAIAIGALSAAAFLAAAILVDAYGDEMEEAAFKAEGVTARAVKLFSGSASDTVSGGRISMSNNYPVGAAHLLITASKKPEHALYLRGFAGGEYQGGSWAPAHDGAIIAALSGRGAAWIGAAGASIGSRDENLLMTSDELADEMAEELRRAYFNRNNGEWEYGRHEGSITLWVQHASGNYKNVYVPYYSGAASYIYSGAATESGERRVTGYAVQCYEQEDVHFDPFYLSREMQELMAGYAEAIKTAYTKVPRDRLPRLTELCEEHPLEGLDEITAFILYTLHGSAEYSLTPGWAPYSEDVIEYFLFENQKGYCQHFASAATLMYQLYGIPARYAAGYAVSPDDFERQEDGTYRAVVMDSAAHAWTEIYLDGYGWTPVDVTPSANGESAASFPGFDSLAFDRQLRLHEWDPLPGADRAGGSGAGSDGGWDLVRLPFSLGDLRGAAPVLAALAALLIACLPFVVLLHRRLRLKKLRESGCRNAYYAMVEALHDCGMLLSCDGTEDDFAARVSAELRDVPEGDVERTRQIVRFAAYGDGEPGEADEEFAVRCCMGVAGAACASQPLARRLWLKYAKGYA